MEPQEPRPEGVARKRRRRRRRRRRRKSRGRGRDASQGLESCADTPMM
jgi:hypothetical protein